MNRIRELRQARGWRQQDLAEKMNTVKSVISRYELEQHAIDADDIAALCDIFGCTSDYLIGRSAVPYSVVTDADALLLQTYHALPLEIRRAVDGLMAPYRQAAEQKTGS